LDFGGDTRGDAQAGIPGSRTALWRFLDRHDLTFKKKAYVQPSAIEKT
jgi:hypothetical protein